MNYAISTILISLLIAFGCGSDEGSTPVISNIQYSPTLAPIGWGGGSLTMIGTVDFVDPDGDLAYIHISDRECGLGPWQNLDIKISGIGGNTSGTVQFVALVSTNCPAGTYTAKISIFDSRAYESNSLYATFTLIP